ncbi:unknown similar to AMEV128 [Mythimna separata entomopoxvirus 'L']|uniref:Uncharacterized protein n=1 Tax=Mythimna separata entomopoxvirus 'L' TaxID=1293572 RepID=A0A916KQB9_9POXV|nr:unknown similar to AMEV128 [Mythimna separata entomopoxvirus 'L']CCU56375.1 unknown similar to AMEV128 [Mythimna separata entomopoxvirus 'L']
MHLQYILLLCVIPIVFSEKCKIINLYKNMYLNNICKEIINYTNICIYADLSEVKNIFPNICPTYLLSSYKWLHTKFDNIELYNTNIITNNISIDLKKINTNILKISNNNITQLRILGDVYVKYLYLDGNRINNIEVNNYNSIQYLYLNSSYMNNTFIDELINLSNLKYINYANNYIYGYMNFKTIDYKNLTINLSNNSIVSNIEYEHLKIIYDANNKFIYSNIYVIMCIIGIIIILLITCILAIIIKLYRSKYAYYNTKENL